MAKEKTAKEVAEEVNERPIEETPEKPEGKQKPKMKVIVSGADFWEFDDNPVFTGTFVRPVVREEDAFDKNGKKTAEKGDVMGYLFESAEDGEEHIIGNSHQIEKALDIARESEDLETAVFYIEFLGKGTNSKNQPFNRFKIGILD